MQVPSNKIDNVHCLCNNVVVPRDGKETHMKQILIQELENIKQAIRFSKSNVKQLLSLTDDDCYLSIVNYQIDSLILDSINNPDMAVYNINWIIDLLSDRDC